MSNNISDFIFILIFFLIMVLGLRLFLVFAALNKTAYDKEPISEQPKESTSSKRLVTPPLAEPNLSAAMVDVGIVTFWGENTAFAHRKQPIPITADAIQPFIKLSLSQWGSWHISFEVYDDLHRLIFQQKLNYFLNGGEQFVTPPARIHLGEQMPHGEWTLEVSVNGAVVASHTFTWRTDNLDRLEGNIDSDGEVDEDILPLLANNYAQPLSLDDLLANNDEKAKGQS